MTPSGKVPAPVLAPQTKEERVERRRRRRSIAVLNDRLDSVKQEVMNLNTKFDEVLLICSSVAGSAKLATRALGIIASAAVLLLLGVLIGSREAIEVVVGTALKGLLH